MKTNRRWWSAVCLLTMMSACDPRTWLGTHFLESLPRCEASVLSVKTTILDVSNPNLQVTTSVSGLRITAQLIQGEGALTDVQEMTLDARSGVYQVSFPVIPKEKLDSSGQVTVSFGRMQERGSCMETHFISIASSR